jgi:DNA polymerase I
LWGDASDNIPGVPGIGEKKAKALIQQFGSMENLLDNLDQVKEKRSQQSLRDYAEQARVSKALATIVLDVPVQWEEESFRVSTPDPKLLIPLLEELEFRTFAKRIFSDPDMIPVEDKKEALASTGQMDLFGDADAFSDPAEQAIDKLAALMKEKNYTAATTAESIQKIIDDIKRVKSFCFDTETTGLDIPTSELVGIAFSVTGRRSKLCALPVLIKSRPAPWPISLKRYLKIPR